MNKIVLIGNGFDLAHKLETRYSDFIIWYLNRVAQEAMKHRYYEDALLKITTSTNYHINEFKTIEDFKYFKEKLPGVELSYKLSLIENILFGININNWVDIESLYYRSLIELYKKVEHANIHQSEFIDIQVDKLNEGFEELRCNLIEYLFIVEKQNDKIDEEIGSHIDSIFEKVKTEEESVYFLNFNYTSTIENYLKNNTQSYFVNYIHGKLYDYDNPIVFGYGDEMDFYYDKIERLNSNKFLKHFKSFNYLKTINYKQFTKFVESDIFEVYIMGHSCGLSDRILLSNMFGHINCVDIKILYYEYGLGKNDFFEKTMEISGHFRADTRHKMRNLIHSESESVPLKRFVKE
ncbi:AbiH family protein [Plebeiibacterium sediminum]|uniref:Bacteriophage abortive infection AbiH family protein n=1 Tax=Plebeiibacterium sediminum TaxID=2992112 RepID=A0AAE3M9U0_9BACT|nr:AbiH family protein [Plebeiobacterium sediminum]MCW3789582.1 bacteriophage abortive infection AbiH family protein [Plebeiobacterium sediminum]